MKIRNLTRVCLFVCSKLFYSWLTVEIFLSRFSLSFILEKHSCIVFLNTYFVAFIGFSTPIRDTNYLYVWLSLGSLIIFPLIALFPLCFAFVFAIIISSLLSMPLIQFSIMSFLLFGIFNLCIRYIMVLFQYLIHFLSSEISFLLSRCHFISSIFRTYFLRFIFLLRSWKCKTLPGDLLYLEVMISFRMVSS